MKGLYLTWSSLSGFIEMTDEILQCVIFVLRDFLLQSFEVAYKFSLKQRTVIDS